MSAAKNLPRHRLVAVVERRLVEAHRSREAAEDLRGRQALAGRRHGRFIPGHVQVPVRDQQIAMLDLHRRRQHDVRVARGVGQKCSTTTVNRSSRARPRSTLV